MAGITLHVNGKPRTLDIDPSTPLLWALRHHLGLTGTIRRGLRRMRTIFSSPIPITTRFARPTPGPGRCRPLPASAGAAARSARRPLAVRRPSHRPGLFDFGAKNGPFKQARFQHPLGVSVSGDTVLVFDTYNSILRSLDLRDQTASDFGAAGFTCQDQLCIPLRQPAGITTDGPDRVLARS